MKSLCALLALSTNVSGFKWATEQFRSLTRSGEKMLQI